MSYFLGAFPDEETSHKIGRVSAELGRIFDSQEISIRLTKPEQLHVTLLWLGRELSWTRRKTTEFKLRNFSATPFQISLNRARLGISKHYRELLYLDVDKGADRLRDLVPKLYRKVGIKRDRPFIPHLTLGRVNKDLSDQEYKNLTNEIYKVSQNLLSYPITFTVTDIIFVNSSGGSYEFIKKFSI